MFEKKRDHFDAVQKVVGRFPFFLQILKRLEQSFKGGDIHFYRFEVESCQNLEIRQDRRLLREKLAIFQTLTQTFEAIFAFQQKWMPDLKSARKIAYSHVKGETFF